ncbi:MAG: MBL fold metallo-hydrolase, partial [Candidatus Nezhaarchaeota archaeon]|nr:MBL fold metallo-hydrolase [Candidatus Nezhaarchaeota archaeon]
LKKMYDDPRNAVFLVSYQAPQTPGRKLLENGVVDDLGPVRARVEWFDFSSHAGFSGLLKVVESFKNLRAVVLIHTGEQARALREALKDRYEVYVPRSGESIEIEV